MSGKPLTYTHTMTACFASYVVQAVVNNIMALLLVVLQGTYGIELSQMTFLITLNFVTQLLVDLLSAGFVDRIGYRCSMILAHGTVVLGLVMLAVLPSVMDHAFVGLLLAVVLFSIGGGLLEVLVSPIVEACPTENKETAMSMLHSFYCWGQVGVVLLTTLFFALAGTEHWKILVCLWAILPLGCALIFTKVPIYSLMEAGERGFSFRELARQRIFWLLLLLIMCAGASEHSVNQWASTFAEMGLQVSKTVGNLAGPMMFAILMGISRWIYGKYGHRIHLQKFMMVSAMLCVASYLLISLSPVPVFSLIGCAVCGFSVGILWPGTFSQSTKFLPKGGTLLFALLAVSGDIGCSIGPTFAGLISAAFGDNLHMGILAAVIFPIIMLVGCLVLLRRQEKGA